LSELGLSSNGKVGIFGIVNLVPLQQQSRHLLLGSFNFLRAGSRSHDVTHVGSSHQSLHAGGVGHNDNVVLALTKGAVAFLGQHPNDSHWDSLHANHLVDGIFVTKEVHSHNFSQNRYLGRCPYVVVH